ncbi:uncharacterized protein EDB93DRAFT_1127121 [Suillus bovinus]|uniref:uncharacterized protein n=1 Tax=Suillus bovinus TaxID=48563 RepID=UPI001B883122|nr:uncharacterized protein EDB93DRAFT_1127121 [Suillus bovinus]KAG2156505.1 hypothetical protein EDB93DRAFT_1127121 [Suillus bovinus]
MCACARILISVQTMQPTIAATSGRTAYIYVNPFACFIEEADTCVFKALGGCMVCSRLTVYYRKVPKVCGS